MAKTAYIHIPFCSHKCSFCDFAAYAGLDHLSLDYCRVVVKEIRERLAYQPNPLMLSSVFYGGGTPGYIDIAHLNLIQEELQKTVDIAADSEITLETTPHAITLAKAKSWLKMGVNRLSIGIESLNDKELAAIGRDHTATDAVKGIETAREAGFSNVSVDLMYGLPEQTVKSFASSLEKMLSLSLPHLSAYALGFSSNLPLLLKYPQGSSSYPSEESLVAMYEHLIQTTAAARLKQYEISNFSYPGFESKHNLTYWSNEEYLGFGVSAHRYVNGVRSSNYRSLAKYMQDCLANETYEKIDDKTKAKEGIFLGLRLTAGIDMFELENKYGLQMGPFLKDKITTLEAGGFLELNNGRLKLSPKGILVSNLVLAELI